MTDKGQTHTNSQNKRAIEPFSVDTIVLDKTIFSNVFEKDIRKVYVFKKAEKIAKAIHLLLPAFKDEKSLRDKMIELSVSIIDASLRHAGGGKDALARDLLTLSSMLSVAEASKIISHMNAEIVRREAQHLVEELGSYGDTQIELGDTPSLAMIARVAQVTSRKETHSDTKVMSHQAVSLDKGHSENKGQSVRDTKNSRKQLIIEVLKEYGASDIKSIGAHVRGVSEKTIQRELMSLISSGEVKKTGERRWTTYTLKTTTEEGSR